MSKLNVFSKKCPEEAPDQFATRTFSDVLHGCHFFASNIHSPIGHLCHQTMGKGGVLVQDSGDCHKTSLQNHSNCCQCTFLLLPIMAIPDQDCSYNLFNTPSNIMLCLIYIYIGNKQFEFEKCIEVLQVLAMCYMCYVYKFPVTHACKN